MNNFGENAQFLKSTNGVILLISSGLAGVALLEFLLVGPPQLLAKSESPAFCASCHVMEEQYTAWSHAGAHRRF